MLSWGPKEILLIIVSIIRNLKNKKQNKKSNKIKKFLGWSSKNNHYLTFHFYGNIYF